jgi:hypothetical protein
VYGLIGFSGRQDRNEALAALLDPLAGAYGEDWWFLGAHGFALTEARGWAAGAPLVERSLALSPRNAHAAHAWAHVLYERGDEADGAAFVDTWLPGYPRDAQLHCHLSWHLALFELARGRLDRASEIYLESIRPGVALSPAMPALADCASLLWRSELAGAEHRADHWKEVAAFAARSFPKIGIGFGDAHCAVAYAAAGEREALERWIAELRIADDEGRLASGSALPMVARRSAPSRAATMRRPFAFSRPRSTGSCASAAAAPSAISSRTRCSRRTGGRVAAPRRRDCSSGASIAAPPCPGRAAPEGPRGRDARRRRLSCVEASRLCITSHRRRRTRRSGRLRCNSSES